MAILMYPDRQPKRVEPIGDRFTQDALVFLIGEGCTAVELVPLGDVTMCLVVDMFAAKSGKPRNRMASCSTQYREIRGNALLVTYRELGHNLGD
jgi:hypothetical protein